MTIDWSLGAFYAAGRCVYGLVQVFPSTPFPCIDSVRQRFYNKRILNTAKNWRTMDRKNLVNQSIDYIMGHLDEGSVA